MGVEEFELNRLIEELKSKEGSGTQLVSIYIPPDRRLSDVVEHVREERSEASNIKSKETRKNVQNALSSIDSRLKQYSETPEKGMVIFAGSIKQGGQKSDMETLVLDNPPEPIESYIYHCDSSFLTEPLEGMLEEDSLYGLIVLDRREANLGWLKGKRIQHVSRTTSLVPGKQRQGGQSQKRFERLRREAIDKFYKEIADKAQEVFLPKIDKLQGILIGGPSPTKEEFIDGEYLHHELQKEVMGKFDVSYTDESGLTDLVEEAEESLQDLELIKERKKIEEFLDELQGGEGLATYGLDEVKRNLKAGSVDTLLLSENIENGETLDIDELVDLAEQTGAEIMLISEDFEEGKQLKKAFGGIAALLRYKI